jgi:hypothetical protein
MKGIDCATPLTAKTAPGIAAAGYGFAARYLVPDGYIKHISRVEAEAITAAGMNIVSVFETSAAKPLGGAIAGKGDAQSALACARKIGQPKGSAIYFTADCDVTTASQLDAIENYLRAATSVLGDEYTVGIYGEYSVIEEMCGRKACKHFWQTLAWSGGKKSAHANIYQWKNGQNVAGVQVDLNESYGGEGWWNTKPCDDGFISKVGANKIIPLMQEEWGASTSQDDKDKIHALANEVRKAAGMPTT